MPTFTKRGTGKRWRGQVKFAGRIAKTKWFGTGKKNGAEHRKAVTWEEQTKKELREQASRKPKMTIATVSVNEWAQAYLDFVQGSQAKKTYAEKKKAFKELFQRGDVGLEFPVSTINRYIAMEHLALQRDVRSGNAANRDRKNLSAAWKWGKRRLPEFPQEGPNPFRDVERFKEERRDRYVPPESHFWRVVDAVEGQDRVMLITFMHLGARRGEIFRLCWKEDVDFRAQRVRVMTRKTRDGSEKYNWLPMTDELKRELLWWWENRPRKEAEHVFLNLSDNQFQGQPFKHRDKFMAVACAKAGVKKFGFHAIRHLAASILFRSGQPLSVIQRILRHESPQTTERYLRSLGFDADLENAVKVFEGRGPAKVVSFAQKAAVGS